MCVGQRKGQYTPLFCFFKKLNKCKCTPLMSRRKAFRNTIGKLPEGSFNDTVEKRLSIRRMVSCVPLVLRLQCLDNSYFLIALLTTAVHGFDTPTFLSSHYLAVRNASPSPKSHSKIADDTFCINGPYKWWLSLPQAFESLRMKCH